MQYKGVHRTSGVIPVNAVVTLYVVGPGEGLRVAKTMACKGYCLPFPPAGVAVDS